MVQGLPQRLPNRPPLHRGVQEDLRELLPVRRRVQVRGARVPHVRRERRRHDRLPGIPLRAERDVEGEVGAEVEVGLQHVRPGRQRVHLPTGDAGDCDGHLQNGGLRHEDARRRIHPREANRQNLPTNGQKHGRQTVPRRVHRRRQERPLDRQATPVRPAVIALTRLSTSHSSRTQLLSSLSEVPSMDDVYSGLPHSVNIGEDLLPRISGMTFIAV